MKNLSVTDWLLIILFVLATITIANASSNEPMISIYDSVSDNTKVVVECSYDNGQPDVRLIIRKEEQEDFKVIEWMKRNCLKR